MKTLTLLVAEYGRGLRGLHCRHVGAQRSGIAGIALDDEDVARCLQAIGHGAQCHVINTRHAAFFGQGEQASTGLEVDLPRHRGVPSNLTDLAVDLIEHRVIWMGR